MKTFCILCVILPLSLFSVELAPWFGKSFELDSRYLVTYQNFQKINSSCKKTLYPSNNLFCSFQLLLPILQEWELQWEASAFHSKRHLCSMEDISLTGRYQWSNDIVGDFLTVTTGLTVGGVFKGARRDVACFHHGSIEIEGDLSFGREISMKQFWTSRWWGVVGIGVADLGSPWLRGKGYWEFNRCDLSRWAFFFDSLWGLGRNRLCLEKPFHGYGPIHHQSIDAGIAYEKYLLSTARLKMEYSYRIYARNCPEGVNSLQITFDYPLGLGI